MCIRMSSWSVFNQRWQLPVTENYSSAYSGFRFETSLKIMLSSDYNESVFYEASWLGLKVT